MPTIYLKLHWPSEAEFAGFLRRLVSRDIEIGVGAAAGAGLIFTVVHYGGGTA